VLGFRARAGHCACAGLILLLAGPAAATAQSPDPFGGDQSSPTADFMFGRPRATLGVRGSFVMQRGGSDLFDFIQDQLTLDGGSLNGPAFAADVGIALNDRIDIVIGTEFGIGRADSEYRDFVDNNLLPIQQTTELRQNSLIGSMRFALTPRGRGVSRLAWIPSSIVPFAGAGGGVMWYTFKQTGDFVDFTDLGVFTDVFNSSGVTPEFHVFGGVDLQVYKRLYLTTEARYVWASAELDSDFIDFDPIDLAGFRFSAGINLLF
jgi:hypothetical protein